jgi:hypothetical protein
MTHALLAPRLGRALVADDTGGTVLIQASGDPAGVPARAFEVEQVLAEPHVVLNAEDRARVLDALKRATAQSQAIDLFVSGLDRSLSETARRAAIRAGNDLVADPELYDVVRRAALSVPHLDDGWDVQGAVRLAQVEAEEGRRFAELYARVQSNIDVINATYTKLDHALSVGPAALLRTPVIACIRQSRIVADLLDNGRDLRMIADLEKRIRLALQLISAPADELSKITAEVLSVLEGVRSRIIGVSMRSDPQRAGMVPEREGAGKAKPPASKRGLASRRRNTRGPSEADPWDRVRKIAARKNVTLSEAASQIERTQAAGVPLGSGLSQRSPTRSTGSSVSRDEVMGIANLIVLARSSVKIHWPDKVCIELLDKCISHLTTRYGVSRTKLASGAKRSLASELPALLRVLRYAQADAVESLNDSGAADLLSLCIRRLAHNHLLEDDGPSPPLSVH